MKVAVLAGDKTSNVVSLLKAKSNFTLQYNSDIEAGLSDVMLSSDINKVVLFDTTFIRNGRELNYIEVFNALRQVCTSKENIEVILISKSIKLFEASQKAMSNCFNFRSVHVESINSQKIIDIILNKHEMQEQVETQNAVKPDLNIGLSDASHTTPVYSTEANNTARGEVQGEYIEPKPQPIQNDKKKSRFKLPVVSKKSLTDILNSRKIVLVTGNHNSGVTNLCCELGYVTAMSGVKTLIIDADMYYNGINMYFDDLDTGNCEAGARTGLLRALRDIDSVDECIHHIYDNLDLLGTRSDIQISNYNGMLDDDSYLSDLVHLLTVDYDVIYIHLPLECLLKYKELVKISTEIVYASNSSINGIYAMNRYLTSDNIELSRLLVLVHRKLKIVLTNYSNPKTIHKGNFCDALINVSGNIKLVNNVCGVINNQKDFDEFTSTKKLYSRDGKEMNNILDVAYNILN